MPKNINIFVPKTSFDNLVTEYDDSIRILRLHNDYRDDIQFVDNPDDADIIILFEEWSFKLLNYTKDLMASPLFVNYANKIYTINYDDYGRGFLPGCYTSLNTSNFDQLNHRACAYPYVYNELAVSIRVATKPKYLFSFRGNTKSHQVREKICTQLSGHIGGAICDVWQQFHTHDKLQKQKYVEEILSSKFVLCPRGWSPSTYRLFEVMSLGRCPVIISDEWIPPEGISWSSCSIKIPEHDIERIPEILSQYSDKWEKLGNQAAVVWKQNFSEEARYRAYLDKILELYRTHEQRPIEHYSTPESFLKRWSSWKFRKQNGWTLPQKIFRRLSNTLNKLLQLASLRRR